MSVATQTYTDTGFEAFGYYSEGSNPALPFTTNHKYLLAANYGKLATVWNIYVPTGVAGYVHYMTGGGVTSVSSYSGSDTQVVNQGSNILYINRIDCTKYGDGRKITFINRYGVQQDLWFFLKEVTSLNRTNEKFQSNTIEYPDDEYADYGDCDDHDYHPKYSYENDDNLLFIYLTIGFVMRHSTGSPFCCQCMCLPLVGVLLNLNIFH